MKKTINLLVILSLMLLFPSSALATTSFSFTSPNKRIMVNVDNKEGKILMSVAYARNKSYQSIVEDIPIGITTSKRNLTDNLTLSSKGKSQEAIVNYTMITGKRSKCSNKANATTLTFTNDKGEELALELRAYNDGVTFRYLVPKVLTDENLLDEATSYRITEGTNRWLQIYHSDSYEDFYPLYTSGINDGNVKQGFYKNQDHQWGYPALVEAGNEVFALITESNIERDHCGSILTNNISDSYKVTLGDDKVLMKGEQWKSPWRVMIIGKLSDIVESTLVTDVAEPAKITETSWIQSGVASWIYWAYNHGSQDYQLVNKYTDLAKSMGWPYTLIDAEWDVMKNGGTMEDAVKYACQQGIKPMIWYNSDANWTGASAPTPQGRINTPENCDKEFAYIKKLGVSGIKVDFFKNDNTWSMNKYLDLLEAASKHKLQIVFHGCTVPRGWQRTYPNLMTCEAVYGAEWYNNLPTLTEKAAAHNATLPFTRNVVGSMDYTPGTFTDSQHPHITTHGHELALPILFESGIQHMPDRPESYLSMPNEVKQLLSTLPTAWDDTKLLGGYPGDYAVIARQKGNIWYIAGVNGKDEEQTIAFKLNSLSSKNKAFKAEVFTEGSTNNSFKIISKTINRNDKITMKTPARGGFVIVLKQN